VSYQIDPSHVAHERLGDEVIIINLDKGAYYSGSGSAADLWSLLVTGASLNHIIDILSKEYRHSPEAVRSDVERCVAALVAAELIQADRTESSVVSSVLPASTERVWSAPKFDEYTDMWDLIKLDPIHDVDEAGWPHALPDSRL
jgi:hypothetical protein